MSDYIEIQAYINNEWAILNPVFTNLKISKIRDKKQLFVMRTRGSGDLTFCCNEYDLLIDFIGQKIEGTLKETVCGKEYEHDINIILSKNFNIKRKKITATFEIKDKYFNLLDNSEEENISTLQTITNSWNFVKRNIFNPDNDVVTLFYQDLIDAVNYSIFTNEYLLENRIGLPRYAFRFFYIMNIDKLILTTTTNIFKYKEYNKIINNNKYNNKNNYNTSLQDLLDLILNKFFAGYYIGATSSAGVKYLYFDWLGEDLWNEDYDFRQFEDENSIELTFLNDNKISIYQYNTFDFNNEKDGANSEQFANTNISFPAIQNSEVKTIKDAVSDILQAQEKENLVILHVQEVNERADFSEYSEQFYNDKNSPFSFADGDFTQLTLTATGLSRIWFDDLYQFRSGGTLEISFNCNQSLTDLYIGTNSFGLEPDQQINFGSNTFYFNIFQRGVYIQGESGTDIVLSNFEVYYYPDSAELPIKLVDNSEKIIPSYLVRNYGVEMPDETVIIDGLEYSVEKSNDIQQILKVGFDNCIGNFDEFSTARTSMGEMRVDEISRIYTNKSYSLTEFTLSTKY